MSKALSTISATSSSSSTTSTTKVINVKVANLRWPFDNLKEWIEADPVNHVYIGRPGVVFVNGVRYPPPSCASSKLFANPFKIADASGRQTVINKYIKFVLHRMQTDPEFRRSVFALKGKILGCWCAPLGCHGDILKEMAENMKEEDFGAGAASSEGVENEKRRQRTEDDDDKKDFK